MIGNQFVLWPELPIFAQGGARGGAREGGRYVQAVTRRGLVTKWANIITARSSKRI